MNFIISLVSFLIVFSLMVFVHEFGHFVVAKRSGVRVREFGFGFPLAAERPIEKRPLSWKIAQDRSGTVYSISLIPFGGFVNLGENDPNDPHSLAHFPKRVRLATLMAGPSMNIVTAFFIFILTAFSGYPQAIWGVGIDQVLEDSPAMQAGIQAQDIVLQIGDLSLTPSANAEQVSQAMVTGMVGYIAERPGQPIPITIQRGIGQQAQQLDLTVTPRLNDQGEGKIGTVITAIPVRITKIHASLWDAIRYSAQEIIYTVQLTFIVPVQMLRGLISMEMARPVGPVGIAAMTGQATQQSLDSGWAYPILHLAGLLNVAIAITNILPIPAMDGGRLIFILIEWIRGKPISPEKEGLVHGIGLIVLLVLFLAITVQDMFTPIQMFDITQYLN